MKLFCVRHGEALSVTENPERPLSIKGQADAKAMGEYLASCGINIPQILPVLELRAKQTATFIAEALKDTRLIEVGSGLGEEDELEWILNELPTIHEDTMIVGHLPFLSRLVSQLVFHQPDTPIVQFSPATVVCVTPHQAQRWIINWSLSPQLLKQKTAADQTQEMF